MKPPSLQGIPHHLNRRERCISTTVWRQLPLLLFLLSATAVFTLFFLYPPYSPKRSLHDHNSQTIRQQEEVERCDLANGHWVPDLRAPLYTNSSCKTIPVSKNCFLHGRKDRDFLNWRWKPDECELQRFDPKIFLEIVRGKKLAFIGDSVARNHMESLLCQLSQVEAPTDVYKDKEDRFRTWHFPRSSFTLMVLWSRFLVTGEERMNNGSPSNIFDLHLDTVDSDWARELPSIDIAIISGGHWLFRPIYLHRGDKIVACIYCNDPHITQYHQPDYAFRMIFRSVLHYINNCKTCNRLVAFLRTFSPAHFENGAWNTGGNCNRTSPLSSEDVAMAGSEWTLRRIQVEEIERVRKRAKGGKRFRVLDITRPMLMRADAHPGAFWGNKRVKSHNDCIHWCLPGPIDVWNDFLLEIMRRKAL